MSTFPKKCRNKTTSKRGTAKHDGCTQITEGFALLLHVVKSLELRCNKMSPSFLFPAFPGLTEVLLSAPPSAIPDFLPRTTNRPIPGVRVESSLPGRPPASRSRQVLRAARPGPQTAPRPSLAWPAPSLASPPPGAWAQAQGPRDLRSRGPTARCCASHPGRGFGPGPLTHPTIARPKSWCFLRAAAPTSPSTHGRKGPATRSQDAPSAHSQAEKPLPKRSR